MSTVTNPWDDIRFRGRVRAYCATSIAGPKRTPRWPRSIPSSAEPTPNRSATADGVVADSGRGRCRLRHRRRNRICLCARQTHRYGLRTDFRLAGDNPGSIVNLQVQYFIEASGGSVETTMEGAVERASVLDRRRRSLVPHRTICSPRSTRSPLRFAVRCCPHRKARNGRAKTDSGDHDGRPFRHWSGSGPESAGASRGLRSMQSARHRRPAHSRPGDGQSRNRAATHR